jgi:hypothetical protein
MIYIAEACRNMYKAIYTILSITGLAGVKLTKIFARSIVTQEFSDH